MTSTLSLGQNSTSSGSRSRTPLFIGIGVVVILVIGLVTWFGMKQSVLSEGNQQESDLSASYADGANYLSNCVVKTHQVANVAAANSAAFDQTIKDAIAGSGAFHTNAASSSTGLMPILVQAYPQLQGQTDLYKKVADVIVGCQDDFRNKQSVVLSHVVTFNKWRTGSWKVRTFGSSFPNDNLTINLPGVNLTGMPALRKMEQPIVDASTSQAYQTGQQSTDGPFNGGASPSSNG